ncbi:MAG: DUF4331 domain-containing protein [Methylophilaceae bacterium]|nr:DUF4331 domain-containing protein [Methylophilaceae bacterium]
MAALPVSASSHREAPFISGQPKVDGTDFYMFRSYETGKENTVTFLADYIPLQDPQGGPNFNEFDSNALYEIHVDNVGDGKEHLTYQFRFNNASKSTPLMVGGKQVKIPLINSGVIAGDNPPALNVAETYTVNLVTEGRRSGKTQSVRNAADNSTTFTKPVDNIGEKSFGGVGKYDIYANQYIYDIKIPGCATNGRVFVGQRTEPFYLALGPIFDLINANPLGPESGTQSDIYNKNISTIALEVPITCVTTGTETVIGGYTTASVRQGRLINPNPSTNINSASKNGGAWSQVSRLGMPLVNEVIIGLEDKDKFNSSKPVNDKQFGDYVTNPTLPALIQTLFPSAVAPTNFPRTDLIEAFLNGIAGINQSKYVTNAKLTNPGFISGEMLRLDTSVAPTAQGTQKALGVPAGDKAGFPNGRRPGDDVVDLSLRVAMGALCQLTGSTDALKVGCKPSDAPAGGLPLNDGVRKSANDFLAKFPYLNSPIPGAKLP